MRLVRGIIDAVTEGVIKLVAMTGVIGETFSRREYFQHYGFTSRPLSGAEGIVIQDGNVVIQIASDDRRYRIEMQDGEVALYDDQGQKIHLKRDKEIEISGCDKLTATVGVEANITVGAQTTVTCPLITLAAETQVIIDTPLTTCTGNLAIGGGITVAGTYGASGGKIATPGDIESGSNIKDRVRAMAADRLIYNGHTHPGDSGGTTGAPNQQE